MKNIFTKHPNKIGESYFAHFFKAIIIGFRLLFIVLRIFIHAIFPFIFEYSASQKLNDLNNELKERAKKAVNHECDD